VLDGTRAARRRGRPRQLQSRFEAERGTLTRGSVDLGRVGGRRGLRESLALGSAGATLALVLGDALGLGSLGALVRAPEQESADDQENENDRSPIHGVLLEV